MQDSKFKKKGSHEIETFCGVGLYSCCQNSQCCSCDAECCVDKRNCLILESEGISSNLLGIQPEQTIYRLMIHVVSFEDVGEMPNFLKGKQGKDMAFYTKKPLPSDILKKELKQGFHLGGMNAGDDGGYTK